MRAKQITSAQAINQSLALAGDRIKSSLLFGEGIKDPSSFFGTTKNLEKNFGSKRIFEMPISENALVGVAIGAAISGKRPIISFHRVEFALLAMEQIVNNAAKMHYTSNGIHKCPILIRLIVGRGWGQGPEHSQSLESIFASIPGLKVIAPVFPHDYKGMILSSVEDVNPVICIEHRWTHYIKGEVEKKYYTSDITTPKIIKKGNSCTIVATSFSVVESLRAAEILEKHGISVEVIDLRVLSPLKEAVIVASIKKTGHLLTVDLGWKSFGMGSEILSRIVGPCWSILKKAPTRIGLPDHPLPSSRGYLPGLYPNAERIVVEVLKLIGKQNMTNNILSNFEIGSGSEYLDIPNPSFQGPF